MSRVKYERFGVPSGKITASRDLISEIGGRSGSGMGLFSGVQIVDIALQGLPRGSRVQDLLQVPRDFGGRQGQRLQLRCRDGDAAADATESGVDNFAVEERRDHA